MTKEYSPFYGGNFQRIPSCNDCLYFFPVKITENITKQGCRKYGQINIFTGAITYRYASECRKNDYLCGVKGRFFEPKYLTILSTKPPVVMGLNGSNNMSSIGHNETEITVMPDYYEKELAKIRVGLFFCYAIFNAVFWTAFGTTVGEYLYLRLWM